MTSPIGMRMLSSSMLSQRDKGSTLASECLDSEVKTLSDASLPSLCFKTHSEIHLPFRRVGRDYTRT